jgi:hypothetical protein
MKNYINKIIVGILGFAVLISAQNVFAGSVTWNQASNDCKSISIINATTLEGYQNPCWPSSSVSANKGETINVRIYYHNTGTVTATNARVVLIPTSTLGSSSTTKTFTGRIVSDQGSLSLKWSECEVPRAGYICPSYEKEMVAISWRGIISPKAWVRFNNRGKAKTALNIQ